MFKDYDKYLSTSLKVYIFVLVLILIMKLVGIDYFGIDLNNKFILSINSLFFKGKISMSLCNLVLLMYYQYIMVSIICNSNSKKMKMLNVLSIPITAFIHLLKSLFLNTIWCLILELSYLYILVRVINHLTTNQKNINKRFLIVVFINYIFQFVSSITRYKYSINCINNQVADIILNLDYIVAQLIFYKLYFKKGDERKCIFQVEVGSFSLKKINLKKLLKSLQANLHKFRELPKQERLSISIYIVLSLLWNTLSLVIILLVANLNHTFIECLFILTSFWLSKHAFGKPFHLPSMIQCFIVSNLTYYILNRITTPLGISIFIPILLGVGLSYVTSKLVKKTYKPLYRGMPKDLFNETILKIVDKDSVKYKICYDFYINKKSDLSLSFEYNYSIAGIRKIKDRINDKIKEL